MKTVSSLAALRAEKRPLVLAAGFFDGVHLGHQRVLRRAIARARAIGGSAWVLTFDRHPLALLRPDSAPPLLTPAPQRTERFRRLGLDGCVALPFTRALAGLPAEAFARRLATCSPPLVHVYTGTNWRFGRCGAGTPALLRSVGRQAGFETTKVPSLRLDGRPVSSTRIRAALAGGRTDEAARLLGHAHRLAGTVVRGRGVGRRLGFPTANLALDPGAVPADGVYAVLAAVGRRLLPGVLNLGVRPTFGRRPDARAAELHLFDFAGRLYGRRVAVLFGPRLREERRFPDASALRRQIESDARAARTALRTLARLFAKESLYTPKAARYSAPLKKQKGKQ
jgi:riboflavin kinase/FMN adenylyltransferase